MNRFETELWSKGYKNVAGIDEVGRGSLAGPVLAAAVIFDHGSELLPGVNDSKKLSKKVREEQYELIFEKAIAVGVGIVDQEEIDKVNILQATFKAMQLAVKKLKTKPDFILLDGNSKPQFDCECNTIVKGDSRSYTIAAASIIAKVTRDRMMEELDSKYPEYNFKSNKGYGSKDHIKAIQDNGLTVEHRETFCQKILTPQLNIFK